MEPFHDRAQHRQRSDAEDQLQPKGVGVVIDAEHSCMTLRGIQSRGTRATNSSLRGLERDDPRTRAEFLGLARAD